VTETNRTAIMEELKTALDRASNGKAKLSRVTEQARIVDDLGLYSLDLLDLRFEVEERWNLRIADEEIVTLKTVGDVINLIVERGA
jgi:acyl carrier protein